MPDPKQPPPTNGEAVARWVEARLREGAADWILGALLAAFMAFVVEVLQWRSYDGISFRQSWLAGAIWSLAVLLLGGSSGAQTVGGAVVGGR
jgi:hypothetical protein